jgi:hypothetical protein
MRKWIGALSAAIVCAMIFAAGCSDSAGTGPAKGPISDPAAGDPANVQAPAGGGTDPSGGAGAGNPAGGIKDPDSGAGVTPK